MQVNEKAILDGVMGLLAGIAKPGSVILSFEVGREAGRVELTQATNGLVVIYTPGDFVEIVDS